MGKHDVDITFKGDVFSVLLELEGEEIDLFFDVGDGAFKRTVTIAVDGGLDVFLHTRGVNGTEWMFEMKVDGRGPFKAKDTIRKGFSRMIEVLDLPLESADE